MKKYISNLISVCCFSLFLTQGCATPRYDYSAYLHDMPRSILVLPPVNESTEVMAPYIYLSTVTRPLAERGYYVFPVAVIDILMKENGLPSPKEMAQVPLRKIREIINPDAVLYMTIVDWGTKYQIIDSVTTVHLRGRLLSAETGVVLWEGEHTLKKGSSSDQGDVVGMLASALINQIAADLSDLTRDVARNANAQLFFDSHHGLLLGARHRGFEVDQREHRALQNQTISEFSQP